MEDVPYGGGSGSAGRRGRVHGDGGATGTGFPSFGFRNSFVPAACEVISAFRGY